MQIGLDCSALKGISHWNPFLGRADANCTKPGPMCRNCKQAIYCIEGANGEFTEFETETCVLNQTCFNGNGTCTTAPNPGCDEVVKIPFPCNSKGMFPDPFNCKVYHICCNLGKSDENTCDKDYGYDPLTTYCKIPLIESACARTPIPACKNAGQVGAVDKNPSIYYICQLKTTTDNKKVLYPMQFLCPNGKHFINNHCEDLSQSNYYI